MWFVILLGFLVTNAFGSKPVFTSFDINISCDEPGVQKWCFHAYFFESDNLEDDDAFWARFCSVKPKVSFSIKDLELGGDGLWDHNYEMDYQLYHTCGHPGFRCSKSKSAVIVTTDKNATGTFNIALNKSVQEKKKCSHPLAFSWPVRLQNSHFGQVRKQGILGKLESWSRHRSPAFNVQDI